MKITRRYGTSPAQRGSINNTTCPDVLALDTGDFLVIGKVPTAPHLLDGLAKHGGAVGDDEMAVVVPADVMRAAARDITEETRTPAVADSKER